ncbi:hypothetical protein MXD60_24540 [Frankia sp. AgB32]|nr:hypothetical protein [Frankia sp. AgB32]
MPADRRGAYLAAAIRRQVGYVAAACDGDRNNALYRAALGQLVAGGALPRPGSPLLGQRDRH